MGALDPGLDRLRRELVDAIHAVQTNLSGRIDGVESRLSQRLETLDTRLSGRADALEAGLGGRIDGVESRLGERIETGEVRLGGRIDAIEAGLASLARFVWETTAETRRHFDVVGEALRSDIAAVAESQASLDARMEQFRDEVRQEFSRVDRRLLRLEAK